MEKYKEVLYGEDRYHVEDEAFLNPLTLDYNSPTTKREGKLSYLLRDADVESFWVLAEECEEIDNFRVDFLDGDARSPHLEDLGYNMVKWLEGLEDRTDNVNLPPVVSALMAIQYDKEGFYGSSWRGKGEYRGIMANIDRKYDRLDKMTTDEIEGKMKGLAEQERLLERNYDLHSEEVGEGKIDAIADLANYSLLYLSYTMVNFPLGFKLWVEKNIPSYLLDNLPLLKNDTEQL